MNFKEAAKESLILSRLHKDRESAETNEVAAASAKDGVTVEDFDLVQRDDGVTYGVFTFAEMPGKYYQTGIVGTKLIMTWASMFNDDVNVAADAYKKDKEKVRLRFKEEKCKGDKSKNVTTIEVLG